MLMRNYDLFFAGAGQKEMTVPTLALRTILSVLPADSVPLVKASAPEKVAGR